MARRPFIEKPLIIKDEFVPRGSASRPDGYVSGATNKEVIGTDGRSDWFRADCRECGHKHITRRSEKSTRYYSCPECGAWHHQNKGFFNSNRFETEPLRNDEVDGKLYRVELDYAVSESDLSAWHYGLKKDLEERIEGDKFEVVSEMEPFKCLVL